jgi:hypothetical protein
MYDKFEPFRDLKFQEFIFKYQKYEVWENGIMIKHKTLENIITTKIDSTNKLCIIINEKDLMTFIGTNIRFERLKTQNDRLQLISISQESSNDCIGLDALRGVFGVTVDTAQKNEFVYCCSLFLKNGLISKLTLSTNDPEKLIEFSSEENVNINKTQIKIAIIIMKLLIDNYDSDGAYASLNEITNSTSNELGIKAENELVDSSVTIINAIFPSHKIVIPQLAGFKRIYFSNYSKSDLTKVLDSLNIMLN